MANIQAQLLGLNSRTIFATPGADNVKQLAASERVRLVSTRRPTTDNNGWYFMDVTDGPQRDQYYTVAAVESVNQSGDYSTHNIVCINGALQEAGKINVGNVEHRKYSNLKTDIAMQNVETPTTAAATAASVFMAMEQTDNEFKSTKSYDDYDVLQAKAIFQAGQKVFHELGIKEKKDINVIISVHGFNTDEYGAWCDVTEMYEAAQDVNKWGDNTYFIVFDWAATRNDDLEVLSKTFKITTGIPMFDIVFLFVTIQVAAVWTGIRRLWNIITSDIRHKNNAIPNIISGYSMDAETSVNSARHLEWLMLVFLASNRVKRMHVMGHSMGCKLVSHAMERFTRSNFIQDPRVGSAIRYKLGVCVLKQGDLDYIGCANMISRVKKLGMHMAIFAHARDSYLTISQLLHGGIIRIGQVTGKRLWEQLGDKWLNSQLQNTPTRDDVVAARALETLLGCGPCLQPMRIWVESMRNTISRHAASTTLAEAIVILDNLLCFNFVTNKTWNTPSDRMINATNVREAILLIRNHACVEFVAKYGTASRNTNAAILRTARPFRKKYLQGHSYFNDETFANWLQASTNITQTEMEDMERLPDAIGCWEDVAVAVWRIQQQWPLREMVGSINNLDAMGNRIAGWALGEQETSLGSMFFRINENPPVTFPFATNNV